MESKLGGTLWLLDQRVFKKAQARYSLGVCP
jgi:hypothetical protein